MKNRGTILIVTGLLLMAAALSLVIYNVFEDHRAERAAQQVLSVLIQPPLQDSPGSTPVSEQESSAETEAAQEPGVTQTRPEPPEASPELPSLEDVPNYILNPEMPMPVMILEGKEYIGVLEVPSCDIVLPVISQWSYPNLRVAPCRYYGSAYTGDMVIVAHNYKSHFRRLKEAQPGDVVRFTDVDGNVFTYEVALLEILESNAVAEMTGSGWDLTLFTCTVGGVQRLTVRCQKLP